VGQEVCKRRDTGGETTRLSVLFESLKLGIAVKSSLDGGEIYGLCDGAQEMD
jgi:hypothetical protein